MGWSPQLPALGWTTERKVWYKTFWHITCLSVMNLRTLPGMGLFTLFPVKKVAPNIFFDLVEGLLNSALSGTGDFNHTTQIKFFLGWHSLPFSSGLPPNSMIVISKMRPVFQSTFTWCFIRF